MRVEVARQIQVTGPVGEFREEKNYIKAQLPPSSSPSEPSPSHRNRTSTNTRHRRSLQSLHTLLFLNATTKLATRQHLANPKTPNHILHHAALSLSHRRRLR